MANFCLLIIFSRTAIGQLPAIELLSLSRIGGQVGTEFDLNVQSGSRTDEVDRIFFSHPGIVGQLNYGPAPPFSEIAAPRYGNFRISIAAEVPSGIYEARVQGRFGLSNSRLFMVTKEPWSQSPGGTSLSSGSTLPMNEFVQDECISRHRKFYHLTLQSKQAIDIRVLTSTLDSRARLLVALVDTSQRQVARAEVLENQDTRLKYLPTQSGTHTLVVSDHLFRGGPEFQYALQATTSASSETQSPESIPSRLIDRWRSIATWLSKKDSDDRVSMPFDGLAPNIATLRMPTIDTAPTVHDEASYAKSKSCPIEFPNLVSGRFDTDADQDWFEFALEAKTEAVIEIVSDRLGELTDPQLIVYRIDEPGTKSEKTHQIAVADDIANVAAGDVRLSTRDAILRFTAPETSLYRLMVRDQQRADARSQRHGYVLELRKPHHDLSAVAYLAYPTRDNTKSQNLAPTITRNNSMAVAVAITRHDGWQGPVEIQAEGLPKGVSSTGLSLAPDQTNGHLILNASPDAVAHISSLSVHASAKIHDQSAIRTAQALEVTWGPIETHKVPMARLASQLALAVDDRDLVPLHILLGSPKPITVERGAKLRIPIAIQRGEGGKQAVIIRLRNAPAKTKANDLTISAEATNGELELNVPADAPLGEFTCWAQCETKVRIQPNPQAFDRAQKRLNELQWLRGQLDESKMKEIDIAIAAQEKTTKELQDLTKPQDVAVQLPSTAMRLQIVEKP